MTREEAKELKDKIYKVDFDYKGDDFIDKIYDDFEEWKKELIEKAKEYLSVTYDFVASEQAKKETNKEKVIEGLIKAMEDEK